MQPLLLPTYSHTLRMLDGVTPEIVPVTSKKCHGSECLPLFLRQKLHEANVPALCTSWGTGQATTVHIRAPASNLLLDCYRTPRSSGLFYPLVGPKSPAHKAAFVFPNDSGLVQFSQFSEYEPLKFIT